jgi:IMP dehydrogenase
MRLLHPAPGFDLTYDDVFMVPSRSAVESRLSVDLSTRDGSGATIPVVAANMTAVAGRRMAETLARRGGLAVIPQDIPVDVVSEVVAWIKQRHAVYDTPITLGPTDTVSDALALLPKRAHGAVVVVDGDRPVGMVTEADCAEVDRFTQLSAIMSAPVEALPAGISPREAFSRLAPGRHRLAPVVDEHGALAGILTRRAALRAPPCTSRPSTPRAGCGWPRRSASPATPRGARTSCSRPASTCSSWTPRTATRSGCSTRCARSARSPHRYRWWPAMW